jgi:hypothetical protein
MDTITKLVDLEQTIGYAFEGSRLGIEALECRGQPVG